MSNLTEKDDFHSVKAASVDGGFQAICTCGWKGSVKDRMSDDYAYTNAREDAEGHWRAIQRRRAEVKP